MPALQRTVFLIAAAFFCVATASAQTTDKSVSQKMSALERLDETTKLYKNLKSYRDEGKTTQEMAVQGRNIVQTASFSTAFERDGRFHWQFQQDSGPGAVRHKFSISSKDCQAFDSYWTLTKKRQTGQELDMPLATATGISGGAATAVIPLLEVSHEKSGWGMYTTDLVDPKELGQESIDEIACTKIVGQTKAGEINVTLWLDEQGLIRKVSSEMTVDTSKISSRDNPLPNLPAFKSISTIVFKPVINEAKVDDAYFESQ